MVSNLLAISIFLLSVVDPGHLTLIPGLGFVPLGYLREESFSSGGLGVSIGFAYRSSFKWTIAENMKVPSCGIFPEYIEFYVPYKKTNSNFTVFWRKFYCFDLEQMFHQFDATGNIYETFEWRSRASLNSYGIGIKQSLLRKTDLFVSLSRIKGNIDEQMQRTVARKLAYATTPVSGWGVEGKILTRVWNTELKFEGRITSKISGFTEPGKDTIMYDPFIWYDFIYFLPDTIENEMPYRFGMEIAKKYGRLSVIGGVFYEGWERVYYSYHNTFIISVGAKFQISSRFYPYLHLTYPWDYGFGVVEDSWILSSGFNCEIFKRTTLQSNFSTQKLYPAYALLPDPGMRFEIQLGIIAEWRN